MEASELPQAVINAHFQLIALNLGSWKHDVDEWLHSEEAESSLQALLANVPCSPTVH